MTFSTRERDVSSSLAEFAAGLEKAYPGRVTRCDDGDASPACRFVIDTPTATLEIHTRPGNPRVIASLSLPTLQVSFHPRRGTPEEVDDLIRHLDRSMHRGGG